MNEDKLAEVVGFFSNGVAKVRFDGETNPSEKEYPYLAYYVPKLGDKVYMKHFGNSYIIFGKINFQVEPVDPYAGRLTTIDLEISNLRTNLDSTWNLADSINNSLSNEYLKKDSLQDELTQNHTGGNGAKLIKSSMDTDAGGNRNISYMYVDSAGKLQVRRVNGQWTTYTSV